MTSITPRATDPAAEIDRLYRAERTMLKVRCVAVVFAYLQVFFYYLPYPAHWFAFAVGSVSVMAIGNAVLAYLLRTCGGGRRLRNVSIASLALDTVCALALVVAYTFDPNTAIWAVLYILPLGGALRFQRRGAMVAAAVAGVGYTVREIWGSLHYHYDFLFTSITFRVGIALLIAWVAGTATRDLLLGRREVDRANHDLVGLNRTLREFVAIASHDMRTPVSIISGLSSTLVRDGASMADTQKHELLQVIQRRAKSLDRLVNDLLATSSIDAGIVPFHPERCDVGDVLSDVVRTTEIIGIELRTDADVIAFADAEHVRRIIGNLVNNAALYGEPPIIITAHASGTTIEFAITDSGAGVPPTFVPRLFQKFARAPEVARIFDGTGLGLAIVEGLVTQNSGTVRYELSAEGPRFTVNLPRYQATEGPNS